MYIEKSETDSSLPPVGTISDSQERSLGSHIHYFVSMAAFVLIFILCAFYIHSTQKGERTIENYVETILQGSDVSDAVSKCVKRITN